MIGGLENFGRRVVQGAGQAVGNLGSAAQGIGATINSGAQAATPYLPSSIAPDVLQGGQAVQAGGIALGNTLKSASKGISGTVATPPPAGSAYNDAGSAYRDL